MPTPRLTPEKVRDTFDRVRAAGGVISRAEVPEGLTRAGFRARWLAAAQVDPDGAADALRQGRENAFAARRAKLRASLAARGYTGLMPGMEAVEVTDRLTADGEVAGYTVRQKPETADGLATPGEPLPGFVMKRLSTLVGRENEKIAEWQIQEPTKAHQWAEVQRIIDQRMRGLPTRPPRRKAPHVGESDLLSQVTLADAHVGALGWPPETGAPAWDLKIARETLLAGGTFLIENLPLSRELLLLVLGDYKDSDGYLPVTPTSKHQLDVDGRFPKIADTGVAIIEELCLRALARFERVRLVFLPGNHDPLSTFWMRMLFTRIFATEPRLEVEQSLRNSWVHCFGRTMIAASHGDKIQMSRLPHVIACDYPQAWGATTHRYGHAGHLRHEKEFRTQGLEADGMLVYQHPTLASRNVWAASLGLSAARQLVGHSYRAAGGLAGKLYYHPDMRRAA